MGRPEAERAASSADGSGKGGQQRGWAGNRHDRNVMPEAKRNEPVARVGNERHSRVAHQCDLRALLHRQDQLRRASQFIVFVVADQRLMDIVMSEKLLSVPRVFACDFVGFLEDAQGTEGDVLEIADGRRN